LFQFFVRHITKKIRIITSDFFNKKKYHCLALRKHFWKKKNYENFLKEKISILTEKKKILRISKDSTTARGKCKFQVIYQWKISLRVCSLARFSKALPMSLTVTFVMEEHLSSVYEETFVLYCSRSTERFCKR